MKSSIPDEVLKKVRLIELRAKKAVNQLFAGQYRSTFKGQGMTFSDFREYVPGDDVRSISWPLTARTGKTYIKKYDEERELNLILAVDMSRSCQFGSRDFLKSEIIAYVSAVLGYSAFKSKDLVGLLLFSDEVEHFVPVGKSQSHLQRIIRDLVCYKPKHKTTKLSAGFEYLNKILKKKSMIFIFSDFMDNDFESSLQLLSKKHEVIAVSVADDLEKKFPSMGLVNFEDAETGLVRTIDTGKLGAKYTADQLQRLETSKRILRRNKVDVIFMNTDENYLNPLIKYFNT